MIFPSRYLEWMTIKLFGWVDECGSAGTAGKAMTKPQDTNSTESHHSDLKQLRCPSGLRGTTQVRVVSAAWVRIPLVAPFLCLSSSALWSCTPHRLFVVVHAGSPPLFFCIPPLLLLLPLSSLPFLRRGARPEVRVVILHARPPLFSSSSF